ncbi:MAG TPA: phosphotransferase [Trueperaceae bacterium]|nr:phosphotransferase [Trueperaceae bacterium]
MTDEPRGASTAPADGAPASGPASPATAAPEPLPAHLHEAARLYGVGAGDLKPLGAYESDVYAFERLGAPRILKVIAPTHRTPDLVRAEVDWLLALREAGVTVAEPVRAVTGEWVELLPDSGHVLVAFERAPGDLVPAKRWTDELLTRWGRLLGQLQAHARGWTAPGPRRRALADHSYSGRLAELAEEVPAFVAAAQDVVDRAAPLLAGGGAGYETGLVHGDLHSGNFLAYEDTLTAIDFDDCGYGSYAFDLAMPLYYAVRLLMRVHEGMTGAQAAERFLTPFLRGFQEAAPLPDGGGEAIDLALRLRQVELVAAVRLKFLRSKDDPGLVALEEDLRDRVVSGADMVPLPTLKAFFG